MSEINEDVQTEETQKKDEKTEIVIDEGGKLKKALKWVVRGLVVVATAVGGSLLGRATGKDDSDDSADAEGPKED